MELKVFIFGFWVCLTNSFLFP